MFKQTYTSAVAKYNQELYRGNVLEVTLLMNVFYDMLHEMLSFSNNIPRHAFETQYY